jgi:hypothetical protein
MNNKETLEVSMSNLAMSFFTNGLMALGEINDPSQSSPSRDLPLAQVNIEYLMLLREKTRNNLTTEENALLGHLINELQMKYLQASKSNPAQ